MISKHRAVHSLCTARKIKIVKNEKGRRKIKRKEYKGSDKEMPSTKALYLIISATKTSPVAFHPSKLKGEGTGSTDTVLFPTA